MKGANLSPKTLPAYQVPYRLLREHLGEDTPLQAIDRDAISKVLKLLLRCPRYVTQKYPKLSIKEAIEQADKEKNPNRLSPKSVKNQFDCIASFFNFAVDQEWLSKSPSKGRYLRDSIPTQRNTKAFFSIAELNRLFSAPLYTGCVDDLRSYKKPGLNHPRRGRFWVPLLGLFQGMRLNECVSYWSLT